MLDLLDVEAGCCGRAALAYPATGRAIDGVEALPNEDRKEFET